MELEVLINEAAAKINVASKLFGSDDQAGAETHLLGLRDMLDAEYPIGKELVSKATPPNVPG